MYQGKGIYRHYKGPRYAVGGLGCMEDAKTIDGFGPEDKFFQFVVYQPIDEGSLLDGSDVSFWIRDREDFDAVVEAEDGHGEVQRFQRIIDVSVDTDEPLVIEVQPDDTVGDVAFRAAILSGMKVARPTLAGMDKAGDVMAFKPEMPASQLNGLSRAMLFEASPVSMS